MQRSPLPAAAPGFVRAMARLLLAGCLGALGTSLAAWILRLPDLFGLTLGVESERFGSVTALVAAGSVFAGLLPRAKPLGRGAVAACLVGCLVPAAWLGADLFITRRRALALGLLLGAAVTAVCSLDRRLAHRELHRWRLGLSLGLLGAALAASDFMVQLDRRPFRTSLPPIEAQTAPPKAPDLLLITLDTLRFDAVGVRMRGPALGKSATPFLDALGDRAVSFTAVTAEAPHTHPAMGSLLTSRPPLEHGSISTSPWIDPSLPTLAEHLRRLGYRTGGFLDNPWLGPEFGLARGYEHLQRRTDLGDIAAWLDRPGDLRPTFLHVHLFTAHGPYELREWALRELGLAPGGKSRERLGTTIEAHWIRAGEQPGIHGLTAPDFAWLESVYLTEVRALDREVEALVKAFDRRQGGDGVRDGWVAVAADHGEEFGDHGALHHSHTVFEELVHVLCLVRAPGLGARRVSVPAGLVDLAPTLLASMGLEDLPGCAGRALLGETGDLAPEARLTMRCYQRGAHLYGLRAGPWKLVVEIQDTAGPMGTLLGATPEEARIQLFDLRADPGETTDVSEPQGNRVAELWAVLQRVVRESADRCVRDGLSGARAGDRRSGDRAMDPRVRSNLRSLGY